MSVDEEVKKLPRIIRKSITKNTSCRYQLTTWSDSITEIEFALRQLDKHQGAWVIRQNEKGRVAVFVPGETDFDLE